MKSLILSFFAVILFYSLVIDKNEKTELNKNRTESVKETQAKSHDLQFSKTDSISFYANKKEELY